MSNMNTVALAHLDDYGKIRKVGNFAIEANTDENKAAESLDGCATSNLCLGVVGHCCAVTLEDGGANHGLTKLEI